ncbi:hypothetical protein AAH991_36300 [Microbispora sp. ZYX-F-249]|uniref:Uncharacterized protein n=1 Tax=Microbispora maris TaxID=3144104 RepID=A0ABV0AZD0_9ACTN
MVELKGVDQHIPQLDQRHWPAGKAVPDLPAVDGEAAGRAGERSEGALGDVQG